MKKYIVRRGNGIVDCKVEVGDPSEDYWLRHLGGHSESFEFGYNGAGPSDLAYSLLADALGEANERCQAVETLSHKLHQQFKADIIAKIPSRKNEVEYTDEFILCYINTRIKVERGPLKTYYAERDKAAHAQEIISSEFPGSIEKKLRKDIERYEQFINEFYLKG